QVSEPADAPVDSHHLRWPPTRRTWLLSSAAALVVLVIVAFAVGGSGGNGSSATFRSAGAKNASTGASSGASSGARTPAGVDARAGPHLPNAPGPQTATSGLAPAVPPGHGGYGQLRTAGVGSGAPSATPVDSLTKIVQTGELDL